MYSPDNPSHYNNVWILHHNGFANQDCNMELSKVKWNAHTTLISLLEFHFLSGKYFGSHRIANRREAYPCGAWL